MTTFRIAIIGAGPAGCLHGRLLFQTNISVTILEGEASPDDRSQGGTLDLHSKSGLAALKEAGLYAELLKHARFDGEALKIMDKGLTAYVSVPGRKEDSSRGRPEIDREILRKLLYESLPSGAIRWGYRLQCVSEDLALHFEHCDESGFDLIVGADGAWSKVRPLLADVRPYYSFVSGFGFKISDADKSCPDVYKLVNRGSLFSFSDHRSLMFQQMGDGSINCGEWAMRPEFWDAAQEFNIDEGKAVKAFLAAAYQGWSLEQPKFIQAADDDSFVYRRLYMTLYVACRS